MRFQTHCVVIAIALQRAELPDPVHHPSADPGPFVPSVRLALYIFAMAVADAFFGQQDCSRLDKELLSREGCGVARIPVQHEILIRNCL